MNINFSQLKKYPFLKVTLWAIVSVGVLYGVFLYTKADTPHTAELRFTESSPLNAGMLIPASCESDPDVANGDGNYSGCSTLTCWDASTAIPAAGESCPNRPPTADAGIDRTIHLPITSVQPAGSGAIDLEDLPVTVRWEQVVSPPGALLPSISNSGTLVPTFSNLTTVGTYTFRLTVTDNLGQTGTDLMNVVVLPELAPTLCAVPPCPTGGGGGGGSGGGSGSPTGDIWADGKAGSISVTSGSPVTITWSAVGATSCVVSPEGWTGVRSDADGETVTPTTRIVYVLMCDGLNGEDDVIVGAVSVNPRTSVDPTLTASPRIVRSGDTARLSWNLNAQTNCTLTAGDTTIADSTYTANFSSIDVQVFAKTKYTMTCGTGVSTFEVEILPSGFET